MTVTIEDIPQKLDVSIPTVTRALNGESDVSQATLAHGQNTAQELDLPTLLTTPLITTVKQPLHKIGRQSVQALLRCIEYPKPSTNQITLPVQFAIKKSTTGKYPRLKGVFHTLSFY